MLRPLRSLKLLFASAFLLVVSQLPAADPPTYRFNPSGKDAGGGQSAIAADPFTPGRLIAGGDIWGFHRSTDYGRDWTPLNIPQQAICSATAAILASRLFAFH